MQFDEAWSHSDWGVEGPTFPHDFVFFYLDYLMEQNKNETGGFVVRGNWTGLLSQIVLFIKYTT